MRLLVARDGQSSARVSPSRLAAFSLLLLSTVSACGATGEDELTKENSGSPGVITGAGGGGQGSGGDAPQGTGAPYPIVLAHGFFGFEDFAGAGFLSYFYRIKSQLEADGEVVLTPAVDPFNDSDFRSEQLIPQIEAFLAYTGAAKVNIIGHSQGGLDARAVAHKRPDLVASVITVATPHYGTPVADVAVKLLGDPDASKIIDGLVKLIGGPLYSQIGTETSLLKPLKLFSKPGIAAFNTKYTDAPGVFYASMGGRSAFHTMDSACEGDIVAPFIKPFEGTLDALDPLLLVTAPILSGVSGSYAHDGLVRSQDARWGEFWGCIPADHLDEIGQLFGDGAGIGNNWSHVEFYSDLVVYLRQRGF
jgi:triacylglycerol lipase